MLKSNLKTNEKISAYISSPPKFVVAKKQRTISEEISYSGIGLHTGNNVSMKLKPAPPKIKVFSGNNSLKVNFIRPSSTSEIEKYYIIVSSNFP